MRSSLLAALCVLSFVSSAVNAQASSHAGCYELELDDWSPPVGSAAAYHRVPSLIHLDTIPRGRGRALSPNIDYPGNRSFPETPRWSAVADTVILTWSNGYAPTVILFVAKGSELIGEAVALSDAHPIPEPPRPRAAARARKVACKS